MNKRQPIASTNSSPREVVEVIDLTTPSKKNTLFKSPVSIQPPTNPLQTLNVHPSNSLHSYSTAAITHSLPILNQTPPTNNRIHTTAPRELVLNSSRHPSSASAPQPHPNQVIPPPLSQNAPSKCSIMPNYTLGQTGTRSQGLSTSSTQPAVITLDSDDEDYQVPQLSVPTITNATVAPISPLFRRNTSLGSTGASNLISTETFNGINPFLMLGGSVTFRGRENLLHVLHPNCHAYDGDIYNDPYYEDYDAYDDYFEDVVEEDHSYENWLLLDEQTTKRTRLTQKILNEQLPAKLIPKPCAAGSSSATQQNESCSICLSEYETQELQRTLPCLHHFHARCIDKWFESSENCPICKYVYFPIVRIWFCEYEYGCIGRSNVVLNLKKDAKSKKRKRKRK